MFIDASAVASGTTLDATVCIIGAGPAGITVARRLQSVGIDCIMIERGGEPGGPIGVGTSETSIHPDSHFEPPPGIPPRFGGGSNEWMVRLPWMARGVRMVPLSPLDTEVRTWIPNSGWPLTWTELEPFLRQAHVGLGLGPWRYGVDQWSGVAHRPIALEKFGFTTSIERFPRAAVVGADAWNEFREHPHVTVLLNARAGSLEGAADEVAFVEVDAGRRDRIRVRARAFVIAGGGVENPRLLLSARGGQGIGATSPALGKYFTDHIRVISGVLTPHDRRFFDQAGLYDIRTTSAGTVMAKLVPTDDAQRENQLLNSAAMLLPRPTIEIQHALDEAKSIARAVLTRTGLEHPPRITTLARAVGYVARLAPEMAIRQRRVPPRTDAGWSGVRGNRRRYDSFMVEHQLEQAPDPSNGFRLNGQDDFGRSTTELTWRWTDLDLISARRTQELLANAVRASGIGVYEPIRWDERPELTTPGGSFHPTGATRMHSSPTYGAVDSDARVHGVKNLFVAGSSVFPTGGYANPTLTLIALALRLADHLTTTIRTLPD